MVKKEINLKLANKAKIPKLGANNIRHLAPYLFMGSELFLGIITLMLVINQTLALAGKLILIMMLIAGFEYQLRQLSRGPSSFEDEFSTLSDILCFAVVPGLLIYQLAFRGWGVLGLISLFVIVFSGMVRLSLYRIYNPVSKKQAFVGLPLTINAAFIALIAQVLTKETMLPNYRLILFCLITLVAFLTVSPWRYPNPAEKPALIIAGLIACGALFWSSPINTITSATLLLAGLGYVLFAPFFVKREKKLLN